MSILSHHTHPLHALFPEHKFLQPVWTSMAAQFAICQTNPDKYPMEARGGWSQSRTCQDLEVQGQSLANVYTSGAKTKTKINTKTILNF